MNNSYHIQNNNITNNANMYTNNTYTNTHTNNTCTNNICNPRALSIYFVCNQFGGAKKKWTQLHHNGVMFPPEYEPHNIPIIYNGNKIYLDPQSEEVASFYAKYIGTEYIENKTFRKNFWNDFKKILQKNDPLGKGYGIDNLNSIDFSLIKEYQMKLKEDKKNQSSEEKEREKKEREKEEEKYKYALMDGKKETIGNYKIEPPGIFIGRGSHPKMGMLKPRIYPEDITLNLSNDAPIPELPSFLQGHRWGNIVHDRTVDWLASWKDYISGKTKYVWFGSGSEIQGQNDKEKFDTARKLKRKIKTIREQYEKDMETECDKDDNECEKIRQVATAVYFIDNYALRVGNEKGADEADTVGVTSLRIEHVTLRESNMIELDFLGKDSIRYRNIAAVPNIVYKNIKEFMKGKENGDDLFDKITSADINKYLQQFMPSLTAKVFRTFNASNIFSHELRKITKKYAEYAGEDREKILLEQFNKANIKVAKLCNHQKNVSKCHSTAIDKITDQIKDLRNKLRKAKGQRKNAIRKRIKALKMKKEIKNELKNISLNTSKVNYIDPRITVAFIKANGIQPEKLFTKTLMEKFKWAFSVDQDYIF